jgi:tetratricopeptide (TPR) repeat protein
MKTAAVLPRALRCAPLAALLCACSTVTVRVPVMKPAEINMAPYSSVAIGGMSGSADRVLTGSLEEALVSTQRFTVVDRTHMDRVMRELRLSASDLADANSAAKLGKMVTAGALIFGDAADDYNETLDDERSKDKDDKVHIEYKLHGVYKLRVTFKVVDVSTGRLLIARTYEERREDANRAVDKRPERIDRAGLERAARQAVIDRFMKAIVPHQEYQNAAFQKDSDIPQLEGGIGWAERGEWKKAQDSFNSAAQDAERNVKLKKAQLAKAYWNLGLSYEYAGDYERAVGMINKAYELSADKDMLRELDNVRQLELDARRLAEQSGGEAAGAR